MKKARQPRQTLRANRCLRYRTPQTPRDDAYQRFWVLGLLRDHPQQKEPKHPVSKNALKVPPRIEGTLHPNHRQGSRGARDLNDEGRGVQGLHRIPFPSLRTKRGGSW